VALLVVLLGLGHGCEQAASVAPAPAEPPWFEEVTPANGLHFVHQTTPVGKYFMPELMGSGAALFDFDNDGRLDVYLLQNTGPGSTATNRLFRQRPDGTFEDVSAGSGLDIAGHNMGVAVGDINNDGLPDVLVTQYGGVKLFLNNGNGTFRDVTQDAGLDNPFWGTSAAFFDYDRDDWLDLVIVNYVAFDPTRECSGASGVRDYCGPNSFPGSVTKLYHNLGRTRAGGSAGVRFEDVTVRSGLGRVSGPGLGVFCADFNGDRWPDILVANDGAPNHLWINQKDGTFTEEALQRGIACNAMGKAEANMGIAVGDVDGDGLFDIVVTHLAKETNTLWKQGPDGLFTDRSNAAGVSRPLWKGTGFGTVLADFDHDGTLDLAIVNGAVQRPGRPDNPPGADSLGPYWAAYAQRNQLFQGDGKGGFRDLSVETGGPLCGRATVARGLACGDVDGDGALDLLVTAVAEPARLYRNVAPRRGHWLMVRAVDPALGGRDAYGAEVTVRAGDRSWRRWLNPGYSYLCSNDPRAHFGLGSAGHVDLLQVIWPDGSEEVFPGRPADQAVVLRKGEGQALSGGSPTQPDKPRAATRKGDSEHGDK
jgi:hypothetical protein